MQPLPPPPTETEAIEPSRWYMLFGVPFIGIGIFIFVFTIMTGLRQITTNLTQVVVPGGVLLELHPGETYTVFVEKGAVVNGKTYSDWSSVQGMTCFLQRVHSTEFVEVRGSRTILTFNWGAWSGKSVLEFTVPAQAQYDFTCERTGDTPLPEGVLAIGAGVGKSMGGMFLQSFVALFVGGGLGTVIVMIVVAQRDRSKRRIRAAGLRPV